MASPTVDIGTGASMVFGTSGFTANKLSIVPPGASRPSLKTSHLGTTTNDTFTPGDLVDRGEIRFRFQFNPDTSPPIDQAAETVTITFRSGATWAATAFMTEYNPDVPFEDVMTGEATLKISGAITIVPAGGGGSGS